MLVASHDPLRQLLGKRSLGVGACMAVKLERRQDHQDPAGEAQGHGWGGARLSGGSPFEGGSLFEGGAQRAPRAVRGGGNL